MGINYALEGYWRGGGGAFKLWLEIPAELLLEQGGMKNAVANQSQAQEERIPFGLIYDRKKWTLS